MDRRHGCCTINNNNKRINTCKDKCRTDLRCKDTRLVVKVERGQPIMHMPVHNGPSRVSRVPEVNFAINAEQDDEVNRCKKWSAKEKKKPCCYQIFAAIFLASGTYNPRRMLPISSHGRLCITYATIVRLDCAVCKACHDDRAQNRISH